jgi:glycosyltransferase involved in cell wall biosynthesis
VVKGVAFAVPGDLAAPTGGYAYDRRIITELGMLGWRTQLVALGDGFPFPQDATRVAAAARLAAASPDEPVVIDGLAFGVLPHAAERLRASHRLIALVHHPLALETGLSAAQRDALRASERAALACACHVVASSATTARLLTADYGVPAERLSVVEPGTDRVAARPRDKLGDVVLLAVGSVIPRKGYDVLVAALAKLKHLPWRLVIAGDRGRSPETSRQLERDIAGLGLGARITMPGAVDSEQLEALYADCDLFVLPSRFEGYGMAYAEAMAHGVPVVGTTAGAIPRTVPADAGVLLPPDDVEALAAALRRLIEDPAERARLAAGARAAKFPSWRDQAAAFARLLEAVT